MNKTIKVSTVRRMLKDRIGYDYTQADMARELEVSPVYVSNVLSGKYKPSGAMRNWLGIGDYVMIDD